MQFPGRALRWRRRLHDRIHSKPARDHPAKRQTGGGVQPYPGDTQQVASAPAGGTYTGSVTRGSLDPVSTAPAAQPVQTASAPPMAPVDTTTTGTVNPQPPCAGQGDIKGWSRAGGTQVTVKSGETVYNLSRRFGVPADVIMKSNGLTESDGLKTGSKIVIPTYVYSDKAGVSAPDNNPNTAKAKSSRGEHQPDQGQDQQNLAVLPNTPKSKSGTTSTAATDNSNAKPMAAGTYKVQEGDTLSRIARNTGASVTAIKEANGLSDGLIRIGQTLKIPGAGGSTKVASAAPATDAVVTNATKPVEAAPAKPAAQGEKVAAYTPPKKTERSSAGRRDGLRHRHRPHALVGARPRISQYGGAAASRTTVSTSRCWKARRSRAPRMASPSARRRARSSATPRRCATRRMVRSTASALKVQRGEKVKRGQEIAVSGMSGQTDSPKLHFEVRKNSSPVDPSSYLE